MLSNTGHYTMHVIVVFVVLFSSALWLPIAIFSSTLSVFLRIVAAILGILAIVVMFNRDVYLPFLADAALPDILIKNPDITITSTKTAPIKNSHETSITISGLPINSKVIWWAAESKDPRVVDKLTPEKAYGSYSNSGVAVTDKSGDVTITLQCPQAYSVGKLISKTLSPHIHYRYSLGKGMLSKVYTQRLQCNNTIV